MTTINKNFHRKLIFLFVLLGIQSLAVFAQNAIKLSVDATEAARTVLHVKETMPIARAGQLTLYYPKWIPGEHTPTGTINDMVNLEISGGGKTIPWTRDDVDMFSFHLNVPAGVKQINIVFDDVSQFGTTMSAQLARIKWNRLLLYPEGAKSDNVQVTASMTFPGGWQYATALQVARETGNTVDFKQASLTYLVDSPAIIGKNFRKVPLIDENGVSHEIDIAADTPEALNYKPETLEGWKNLIKQANALFGVRHYNNYKFLLTLSDVGGSEGLEHHESSEDGVGLNALSDPLELNDLGDLLGHEYAHSWNGKYRRPAGLATGDYETPQKGELLWVYEGLTQYLGNVLPARSGLWTPETFRDVIADNAASMDTLEGRNWRPLVDTARGVQLTYAGPRGWRNERRGADYYIEGLLTWMEADVLIRQKSGGKLSLDDFCRKFHGVGGNTAPKVVPYTLDEVVITLNQVVPYDWRGFLTQRIYSVNKHAPLGGITNGGWRLVYNDTPNVQTQLYEHSSGALILTYSVGLLIRGDGVISDITPDLAGGKAGLAPGMRITSVNGQDFSVETLRSAVAASKDNRSQLQLVADNGGTKETYNLNYHGGLRYAHLERVTGKADILAEIIKPVSSLITNSSITKPIASLFMSGSKDLTDPYGYLCCGFVGKKRPTTLPENKPANVTDVLLSQYEVMGNCPANSNNCNSKTDVSTTIFDSEKDVVTYSYTVSAGKIIGNGGKVLWDLSGVIPGTYTITSAVDDGCGFCGTSKTQMVTVK